MGGVVKEGGAWRTSTPLELVQSFKKLGSASSTILGHVRHQKVSSINQKKLKNPRPVGRIKYAPRNDE